MKGSSVGDRMRRYEAVTTSASLTRRVPVIVRIDGRAFHTWSKGLRSPYDETFHEMMCYAMVRLCETTMGARLGYHFSDEVSLFLADYRHVDEEAHFDYSLQKLVSVMASEFTAWFAEACRARGLLGALGVAEFDCRAFNVPRDDVANYFIWRQQDCTRNSVQMAAREHYGHDEMEGKNSSQLQDMLMERGVNWNDETVRFKRGVCCFDRRDGDDRCEWVVDYDIPIFTADRGYVHRWVPNYPLVDDGELHTEGDQRTLADLGF